ncbi:amidohydrolase [Permianibacter aggregans]|uniref:Hippurate hydrolase n=1 Tax=Permianibacter aggregans TaxID=1510150 RepID=A0A4R6UMV7_9GAMM|nr:amidohydrolase [Permianibacter aggregans]QGX38980.1 amidohydrolase [Permianibacter aggregans]TDQ46773.1 hippurate hydrolase [Permianibacter aggregans]
MKRLLVLTLVAGLAQAADDYPYLFKLYQHFHSTPELSFHEKETSKRLAMELQRAGFKVTEKVGGWGVVAVMRNGDGPTVLLRADMDALPVTENTNLPYASKMVSTDQDGKLVGIMHACGHDIHMTSLVGAARELAARKNEWKGTLVLIGQPAEERGGGAKAMLADGLYQRFPTPDYAVALHTSASHAAGTIAYSAGPALASVDSIDIKFKGVGGHGAYPHKTKDPIVLASQFVLAAQTIVSRELNPREPAVVTVGSFQAGAKHNIIPEQAHLQLTVRSYSPEVREHIIDSLKRIADGLAVTAGMPANALPEFVVKDEYTPPTINDPELTERLMSAIGKAIGEQNVQRTDPVMGGEDFSRYSMTKEDVPAVIFWVGGVAPAKIEAADRGEISLPSLHSPEFAPVPEPTIRTGVKGLVTSALELLAKQ